MEMEKRMMAFSPGRNIHRAKTDAPKARHDRHQALGSTIPQPFPIHSLPDSEQLRNTVQTMSSFSPLARSHRRQLSLHQRSQPPHHQDNKYPGLRG
jgi:hypothetical protein